MSNSNLPIGLQELRLDIDQLSWLLNHPDEDSDAWWLLCNQTAVRVEDNIIHLTSGPFDK